MWWQRVSVVAAVVVPLLLSLLALRGAPVAYAQTSVAVELGAAWKQTPLYMEAAELLADVSEEQFWNFVDRMVEGGAVKHDRDGYQRALAVTKALVPASSYDAIKLALEARTKSPKVAMFFQMAADDSAVQRADDCSIVAVVGDTIACTVDDFERRLSQATPQHEPRLYDTDHVHTASPGTRKEAPLVAVLYADIGSGEFKAWHSALAKLHREGRVQYVLRHFLPAAAHAHRGPMRLGGWGTELAIKKTEYTVLDDSSLPDEDAALQTIGDGEDEVSGFSFTTLRELYPEHTGELNALREALLNNTAAIQQLKAWELQDISFQAASRVLAAKDPISVLQRVSQNFPSVAHTLANTKVDAAFRKEVEGNQRSMQQLGLGPGTSALIVNNVYTDVTSNTNLFSLLNVLQSESDTLGALRRLGLPDATVHDVNNLLATQHAKQPPSRVDVRSTAIKYINDLEKDSMYSSWQPSLMSLLRPGPPAHLRKVGRNLFTLTAVVDTARPSDRALLLRLHSAVFKDMLPARVGVVFVSRQGQRAIVAATPQFEPYSVSESTSAKIRDEPSPSVLVARAFDYYRKKHSTTKAFAFLTSVFKEVEGADDDSRLLTALKTAFVKEHSEETWEKLLPTDTRYDASRKKMDAFANKIGLGHRDNFVLLFNGEPLPCKRASEAISLVHAEMASTLPTIQRAVYYGWLPDRADVLEFFMKQGATNRVLPSSLQSPARMHALQPVQPQEPADDLLPHINYFVKTGAEKSIKPITYWLMSDLDTESGRRTAFELLRRLQSTSKIRAAVIHSGSQAEGSAGLQLEKYLHAIARFVPAESSLATAGKVLERVLAGDPVADTLGETVVGSRTWADIMRQARDDERALSMLQASKRAMLTAFGLGPQSTTLFLNGHVFGPIDTSSPAATLTAADFYRLDKLHGEQINTRAVAKAVDKAALASKPQGLDAAGAIRYKSDIVAAACATLSRAKKRAEEAEARGRPVRRVDLSFLKRLTLKHSSRVLNSSLVGKEGRTTHKVIALVDPATDAGQRLGPALSLLLQHTAVEVTLVANPTPRVSEMPVNRFYRAVTPSVSFAGDGSIDLGPRAVFANLPRSSLLTLGLETPSSWMVKSVESRHDLDNIHLQSSSGGVYAVFQLEHMAVEGSCSEASTRRPTAGLQLELATRTSGEMHDTLVMANLGYFQLKATPGAWDLSIREGRSSNIFRMAEVKGADSHSQADAPVILVHDLEGTYVSLSVDRRPGMEKAKLLDDGSGDDDAGTEGKEGEKHADGKDGSLWDSLKKLVPGSKSSEAKEATREVEPAGEGTHLQPKDETLEVINVFSLASGHLYERFLKIMMLSVLKNTENPVKFWFLENCMSPQMKSFLPHMAEKYGFQFELVSYNWPAWLNKPKERMRLIWAYKILFLDVLFPLDVKKIIFVDADQVVRADLNELLDLDLEGAPYGYTPFCSSREGMSGFRFWESGYWKNHLAGKPYHISALYVVDLVRFRQFAAGDRLREQYQALSRDPNSLSNLDQDLPNNMIHQVPIKSLPQEWLWCESWCDDASKKKAKTIDLCNNPKTKEPKLEAAVRIVPEWTELDEEARAVTREFFGAQSWNSTARSDSTPGTRPGEEGDRKAAQQNSRQKKHDEL